MVNKAQQDECEDLSAGLSSPNKANLLLVLQGSSSSHMSVRQAAGRPVETGLTL